MDFLASEKAPEIHIEVNYSVRPFAEVEKEYLALFDSLVRE